MALKREELGYGLDGNRAFNTMRGTPYYDDAVYDMLWLTGHWEWHGVAPHQTRPVAGRPPEH